MPDPLKTGPLKPDGLRTDPVNTDLVKADLLKTGQRPMSGTDVPRFVYRLAPPSDGGTVIMIAAALLIALAIFYLVFTNLP